MWSEQCDLKQAAQTIRYEQRTPERQLDNGYTAEGMQSSCCNEQYKLTHR